MCEVVCQLSAYWFRKSVRCSSGVSVGTFKKVMLSSFFFFFGFVFRTTEIYIPSSHQQGSLQNASIISLLLNVMDRKFLFEETCIVSVKRRTFLSASASAKSLWFRSQSLARRMVCCSLFILVVTVRVVFLRFFHGS